MSRLVLSLFLVLAAGSALAAPESVGGTKADARPAAAFLAKGAEELRRGAMAEATTSLTEAVRLLQDQADKANCCEALCLLAQTGQHTGRYRKALESLVQAHDLAGELGDQRRLALVEGAMGNAYLGLGENDQALAHLQAGLQLARQAGAQAEAATILNNLGNLYATKDQYPEAAAAYQESAELAVALSGLELAATAAVNGAVAALRGGMPEPALRQLDPAMTYLGKTPDSQAKAFGLINAGLAYTDLSRQLPDRTDRLAMLAHTVLTEAVEVARRTGDHRTLSYAYGYLGRLYEEQLQYEEALDLSGRAVFAAQRQNAAESLYRWHWQSGRILGRLNRIDPAIVAYRHAIRDLRAIREEMASCYASPETSYLKTAGLVCAELVDLLLQRAANLKDGETEAVWLAEARETLEILKVFELREYFKDDCVDAAQRPEKNLDAVAADTAVIYPVFLPDRVELLVSLAGRLQRVPVGVGVDEFIREVRDLRRKLVKRTTWSFLPHSRQLYDWLIRPLTPELEKAGIKTLVFVPAGPLRTVPMAALHDGANFLINRFQVAVTPGLNLTDPRPLNREDVRLLALGLTEAVQGFPGLPHVADELSAIREFYPGDFLLDDQFRLARVEEELKSKSFTMIHIASHGQFGGHGDDTFVLAFTERFSMDRLAEYVGLSRFREQPLDLLVLSACETAAGDERAALGLAGVGVRAGARSVLATLWHVNDPASRDLIAEFYRRLQTPGVSRAAALRAAQLKLINDRRYEHPGYWAPFLLINNWL